MHLNDSCPVCQCLTVCKWPHTFSAGKNFKALILSPNNYRSYTSSCVSSRQSQPCCVYIPTPSHTVETNWRHTCSIRLLLAMNQPFSDRFHFLQHVLQHSLQVISASNNSRRLWAAWTMLITFSKLKAADFTTGTFYCYSTVDVLAHFRASKPKRCPHIIKECQKGHSWHIQSD